MRAVSIAGIAGLTVVMSAAVTVTPAQAAGGGQVCSPATYGARGDATTDNTLAIQRAIDACAARGGGVVALAGQGAVFDTGPIHLRSHIDLSIASGTTLRSVADSSRYTWAFIGYTPAQSDSERSEALISAEGAHDVSITGHGTIDGLGQQLWWTQAQLAKQDTSAYPTATTYGELAQQIQQNPGKGSQLPASVYAALGNIPTSNGLPRPWLVEFYGCSGVHVSGVNLTNSPMWNLALRYSNEVSVDHVTVANASTSPNTDGVDVVSSTNVALDQLTINTGDDDVAIKSGFPGFPMPAQPTRWVAVTNSSVGTGHGISIGSEAVNGVQDVLIQHITYTGTANGLRIKSGRDRGSDISHIWANHLTMSGVAQPLYFTDYYTGQPAAGTDPGQPVTATTPHVHDVTVSNLTATGATGSEIIGLPEAHMRSIVLHNVTIQSSRGLELRNTDGSARNLTVQATTGPNLIIDEGVTMTGLTP